MKGTSRRKEVPPSPEVMSALLMDYLRRGKPAGLTFRQFLKIAGYFHPSDDVLGMDDNVILKPTPEGMMRFPTPDFRVEGDLRIIVLLVDFPDMEGHRPVVQYDDLLFSRNVRPNPSMADYFHEVSLGKVHLFGSVHGWLRMPQTYSYYTNGQSGLDPQGYPRNAQRMAEDAVEVALDNGVDFPRELDKLNRDIVTALFVVHAGLGAETQVDPWARNNNIWSHKWNLAQPKQLPSGLWATIYLTVPEGAKLGVCAHELGHLAFQWGDFYDWNYAKDSAYWDGTGDWDLMASGSYNGNSSFPAHPLGLHKAQHGWIDSEIVTQPRRVVLPPFSSTAGKVVKIAPSHLPKHENGDLRRYILLENRQQIGFDKTLPGSGLLVWLVDEKEEMVTPIQPGVYLVQADGKNEILNGNDSNQGDAGDPFPGSSNETELLDEPRPPKNISTIFFDGQKTGVRLRNIKVQDNKEISLDVEF